MRSIGVIVLSNCSVAFGRMLIRGMTENSLISFEVEGVAREERKSTHELRELSENRPDGTSAVGEKLNQVILLLLVVGVEVGGETSIERSSLRFSDTPKRSRRKRREREADSSRQVRAC